MSNETLRAQNLPPVPEDEKDEKGRPVRYRDFCFELYPDNDLHMRLLAHLEEFPKLYRCVYILHSRDKYDDDALEKWKKNNNGELPNWQIGDIKKPHYHVLIHWKEGMSLSAMRKHLRLDYVEGVSSIFGKLCYFLHKGPQWWDKEPYSVSELHGDSKTISLLESKTQILYNLGEFADFISGGVSLLQLPSVLLKSFSDSERSQMLECFDKYEHFIVAMANQYDRLERKNVYDTRNN